MTYFVLLFLILPSKMLPPFAVDLQSKAVTLSKRPVQGDTVAATLEIIPKETKEDLKVTFFWFEGTQPVGTDTVFPYNARKGERSTFSIDVVYLSTPALFKARVTNEKGRPNGLDVYRYMIDAETKEYATRKEIQYQRPIEYRFNAGKRYFEQEILRFENDRWMKNRAIIDSMQQLDGKIPDSLALVLYADIQKVIFPKGMSGMVNKAEYLIQKGWSGVLSESERNNLFDALGQEVLEEERRAAKEKERQQRRERMLESLIWITPTVVLISILILLFRLRKRASLKAVTPFGIDKAIRYFIYLLVICTTVYFAYPYLSRREKNGRRERRREINIIEKEIEEAVEDIMQLDELKQYVEYPLVHKSPVGTKYGTGANIRFKDAVHSKLGIEYHFLVKVYPTKEGNLKIVDGEYDLEEIIGNIERNEKFAAFVSKLHIKKVKLERGGKGLLVSIDDTITKGSEQYRVSLQYDYKGEIIRSFSVPAYFADPLFPELDTLRKRCEDSGYPIRHDKCIKYKYQGRQEPRGYATLVENGGSDTLWMWFSADRPKDIGHKWNRVPRTEFPHAEIIEQLYGEFEKAGLPYSYVREHLKVVTSIGKRESDYFKGREDKGKLEARIKWKTGYKWIDQSNKGDGIHLVVSYEYSNRTDELGRILGKPGCRGVGKWRNAAQKRFYLKPITDLISEEDAREKLFSMLPEDKSFSSIYIELNIPEEKEGLKNFIYLVGIFNPRPGVTASIKVNLKTGEILQAAVAYIYS